MADVYLVKSSEIGNSAQIHTRTHLGYLLNPGDLALGFDLSTANLNEPNWERYEQVHQGKIPDVILVKKYFGDRAERRRQRRWRLKRLNLETASMKSTDDVNHEDYNEFMEDLEEDCVLRQNVNIYKDLAKINNEMMVDSEELPNDNLPVITLDEMLDDLNIGD